MKMRNCLAIAVVAAATAVAGGVTAAEVEVKMLNRGAEGVMVFEPALVKVEPGVTVKFVATDKGHNAETIKGMLPDGAATFLGKNGEDTVVKFDRPGIYGVKYAPHYGMGMVAMIVVGAPVNEEKAKAVPQTGKAKQVFATLFEQLAASKTAAK
jgi:pseudoazurin